MLGRRKVLAMGAALPFAATYTSSSLVKKAFAQERDPFLPDDLQRYAGERPYYDLDRFDEVVGSGEATDEQKRMANAIIDRSPNGTPFDVAMYFYQIAEGRSKEAEYTQAWRPYVSAWPTKWNPLLKRFFTDIGFDPATVKDKAGNPLGDALPWCSAFVNWCIWRSNQNWVREGDVIVDRMSSAKTRPLSGDLSGQSYSAVASGSFRNWGEQAGREIFDNKSFRKLKRGDIVVWNELDPARERNGNGHVAFYYRQIQHNGEPSILTIGGNNIYDRGSDYERHRISRKSIRHRTKDLKLHSIRSLSSYV